MSLHTPIEDKLHVIIVFSNACGWRRRYQLAHEFTTRMQSYPDIILYTVELAYGDQPYVLTSSDNRRHLQLRAPIPLWHKENMINLGVQKLLPKNWRAFAWIDADIQFDNLDWATTALKVLHNSYDLVQLFTRVTNLDSTNRKTDYQLGCVTAYSLKKEDRGHPGFAWAMTRELYERLGGLFEYAILGGCDSILAGLTSLSSYSPISCGSLPEFDTCYNAYAKNVKRVRLGCIPGSISHYYHGDFRNRKYGERWKILVDHKYNPRTCLTKNAQGVLIPTATCPRGLLEDIMQYFWERNEDKGTFPDHPIEQCPNYLGPWVHVDSAALSSRYTGLQLPIEALVPRYETIRDTESFVVPGSDEASVDMQDSKNERAIPIELEYERVPELEQTSSTAQTISQSPPWSS